MFTPSSTHFSALYFSFFRFEFVQIPLFHPLFKRDHPSIVPRSGPPTRSDTVLTGNDWATLVVAKLSPWLQLESRDPNIRRLSEDVSWKRRQWQFFLYIHLYTSVCVAIPPTQHFLIWGLIVGKPGLHRGGGGEEEGWVLSIEGVYGTVHPSRESAVYSSLQAQHMYIVGVN